MEQFLPAIIFSIFVAFIMMKQIQKITNKLDKKEELGDSHIYAQFATLIQEHVRAIKVDIDSTKDTPHAIYTLNENTNEEKSLEFLSDNIRKLVFFETMNAKHKKPKDIEADLFSILTDIDTFLKDSVKDGDLLAQRLRDDLFEAYNKLQEF